MTPSSAPQTAGVSPQIFPKLGGFLLFQNIQIRVFFGTFPQHRNWWFLLLVLCLKMGVGFFCFLAAQIQADLAFSGVPNWVFFLSRCRPRIRVLGVFLCCGSSSRSVCAAHRGKSPFGWISPRSGWEKGEKEKGGGPTFESAFISSIERYLEGGVKLLNPSYK